MKKIVLIIIRLLVSLNLLYGAIFYKFAGVPFSIALFTTMSNALHGWISQPVFRIGSGILETIAAILFLIPQTVRLGAKAVIAVMCGVLLSHIFVLGYGFAFLDALATTLLPCIYLWLTRTKKS